MPYAFLELLFTIIEAVARKLLQRSFPRLRRAVDYYYLFLFYWLPWAMLYMKLCYGVDVCFLGEMAVACIVEEGAPAMYRCHLLSIIK